MPNSSHIRSACVAALALLGDAGCESCDFSFGPIPVEVELTPIDVPAEITVCAEGHPCETHVYDPADDTTGGAAEGSADELKFQVGWHGYATCKVPRIDVKVAASGCEPTTVTVERHRPEEDPGDAMVVVPVTLACG